MPGGKPTKFSPEIMERILPLLRLGHTTTASCQACGVSPRTFYSWMEKGRNEPDKYPELAMYLQRYMEAEGYGIVELEKRALTDGRASGELALKILERRRWKEWGQQNWRIKQLEREIAENVKLVAELKQMICGVKNEEG